MKTTEVPDDYYEDILWPEHIKKRSKYVKFLNDQYYIYNKNVLIIDGNKQYNPKDISSCILKWVNVSNFINNNIYNDLFTSFDKQMTLLKNNFLSS